MLKNIVFAFLILAVAVAFLINMASRKAPDLIRAAIGQALNKDVAIGTIEYRFPWIFEITQFEIKEKAPFTGETSFAADYLRLDVSPLSWSRKELMVDRINVENARIVVRKYDNHLAHAFSSAMKKTLPEALPTGAGDPSAVSARIPLKIQHFSFRKCRFEFIDYDVDKNGFVIALVNVDGSASHIAFPFIEKETLFELRGEIAQGREEKPGALRLSGAMRFDTLEGESRLQVDDLSVPFFRPYYGRVTSSVVTSGYLDLKSRLMIHNRRAVMNVDAQIRSLFFEAYEQDNLLFGLKAEEILSFMKDRSGKLKLPAFAVQWNIDDKSVHVHELFRRSIEQSLKKTIVSSIADVVLNAVGRTLDDGGEFAEAGGKGVEDKIKKIKDFFKY